MTASSHAAAAPAHSSSSLPLRIFTVVPRDDDFATYLTQASRVAEWTAACGWTGVLVFTGNDTLIEPWVMAHHVLEARGHPSPLVAVNPVYMHPFTVAKFVASLTRLYGKQLYLNLVAGTALSHERSLGNALDHDARYERLTEFTHIVMALLSNDASVTFHGRFYEVEHAQLPVTLDPQDLPGLVVAGQSDAARRLAQQFDAAWMKMLPGSLDEGLGGTGAHFGVVCRPTTSGAERAFRRVYPDDPAGRRTQRLSLSNTDAEWKRRLFAAKDAGPSIPGYSLEPFLNAQADCPFVTGSYDDVADVVARLIAAGARDLIIELPPRRAEFTHAAAAVSMAVSSASTIGQQRGGTDVGVNTRR